MTAFIYIIFIFYFQLKWDENDELEWTQNLHPLAENVVDQNMNPYDIKLNGNDISGTDCISVEYIVSPWLQFQRLYARFKLFYIKI